MAPVEDKVAPVPQVAGLGPHRRLLGGWWQAWSGKPPPLIPQLPSSLERQSGTCQHGQFTSIWKIKEIK